MENLLDFASIKVQSKYYYTIDNLIFHMQRKTWDGHGKLEGKYIFFFILQNENELLSR